MGEQRPTNRLYHLVGTVPHLVFVYVQHAEAGRPQRGIAPGVGVPVELGAVVAVAVGLDDQPAAPVVEVDSPDPRLAA